jgi:hypothetical protein
VNVVVAEQAHADGTPILDRHGKDISTTKYVTSLRPGLHGIKVRGFYRSRWGVENQGFRYLSQTWEIDRLAGHSYGAVLARLGIRVHDLQRQPSVPAAKPTPAALRRRVTATAAVWGRVGAGGSNQHRAERVGLLLCDIHSGPVAPPETAYSEGFAAGTRGGPFFAGSFENAGHWLASFFAKGLTGRRSLTMPTFDSSDVGADHVCS